VLVGDPALGTRSIPVERFAAAWKTHLVFVIHNRRTLAIFNSAEDWRVAPMAPMGNVIDRNGLFNVVMPRRGPGDI
jgi:predicted double-glycine peptidase